MKEPWEMTRSEFYVKVLHETAENLEAKGYTRHGYNMAKNMLKSEHCDYSHSLHIQEAISRGDVVPENVLREYQ